MIRSVEIQRLRGIREGRLDDLTPLTVLVGPNGCGKSTLIDALYIGSSPRPGDAIGHSVQRRLGVRRGARWLLWRAGEGEPTSITITTGEGFTRTCELTLDRAVPETDKRITIRCEFQSISGDITKSDTALVHFQPGNTYNTSEFFQALDGLKEVTLVEGRPGELQTPLYSLYTKVAEQGRRKEARSLIAEVVPDVQDIEILAEDDTPLVYLIFEDYSIPAAMAGDGVQAVLRLSLELITHAEGLVLLEEPEVHQHPGAIRQSARAILAAVRRGIQVVISTHSLELIDALLTEARDPTDMNLLSIYRLRLEEGLLRSFRVAGPDVAFARTEIGDDLR